MRIAPTMNYNTGSRVSLNTSAKNTQTASAKNEVSFESGWRYDKIRELWQTAAGVRESAEYFHKLPSSELKDITTIRNFWGFRKKEDSEKLYAAMKEVVSNVLETKNEWLSRIASLSVKEAKNAENIASEKLRVQNLFINMLDTDHVTNGIVIHGTSREKESFLQWLSNIPGLNSKEMTFDIKRPLESLQELIMYAENAKTAKTLNGKRTLLQVNNLDDLLTSYDTAENRRLLARFKSFSETSAKDYDTTIVTSTNHLLENFEESTIKPHRLGLHVKLTEHLTDSERGELTSLREKVKELDKKADDVYNKFYESAIVDLDYDDEPVGWLNPHIP